MVLSDDETSEATCVRQCVRTRWAVGSTINSVERGFVCEPLLGNAVPLKLMLRRSRQPAVVGSHVDCVTQ